MTSPNQARGGVKRVGIVGAELGGCGGGEKGSSHRLAQKTR